MTAPAEDPRGGEACSRCGLPKATAVHSNPFGAGHAYDPVPAVEPEPTHYTVTLNGQEVVVREDPDLKERGLTDLTYDYRQTIAVRSFSDLDGRVLLHEFLHALLRTDPQMVCPAGDDRHEDFVRMLTAGLHDVLGYRRPDTPPAAGRGDTDSGGEAPTVHEHGRWCLVGCDEGGSEPLPPADLSQFAARPAGDRAQPTQELREAIARTLSETVLRLRFSDDDAPWPSDDDVSVLTDALIAGPLAALLDAQAAVEKRIEVARIEGRAESLNAEVHEMEDDDDAQLLAVRAIQWEQEAADLRRALDGTT